jgi:hypothetical protein
MGKIWVLDTETKGTVAEMVPLERALKRQRSAPRRERLRVVRRRRAPKPEATPDRDEAPVPWEPSRFKVVSALSGQVLAEGTEARETVEALAGLRSMVDARIHVWEAWGWRPLTLREQRLVWELRDRVGPRRRSTALR